MRGLSDLFKTDNLHVAVVGMELGLLCCPDNIAHASGFDRQEFGVMDLDFMFMSESVFCLC
jgi:hypothetical protein